MLGRTRFLKSAAMGLAVLAGVTLAARPANATTFTLDQCHAGSDQLICNVMQIELNLVGNAIDVDVTGPSGWGIFGAGNAQSNQHAFGFGIVGSTAGVAFSNMTNGFSFFGNNSTLDGLGLFEFIINGPQQGKNAAQLHFRISRTAGFSSVNDLLEANSQGWVFAAHVRNGNSVNGDTGFAAAENGNQQLPPVPEPASLMLLGTGLAGLMARARARRRSS